MFSFGKQPVYVDKSRIQEALTRSVGDAVDLDLLQKRMEKGERLRVKLGIDPTSPNIHLGRAVQLLKLRDFQTLGHTVVLIVGDFTGQIGDTSDKDSERPLLNESIIRANMRTYKEQASRILDMRYTEVVYNSKWLSNLTYRDIGEHANLFSVSDFIGRENIRRRLKRGVRVSVRELIYPMMQGYDSVMVHADVEIGGSDQWFNLLAGRTLQAQYNQTPQALLTTALILGTDGRKMSSSWGNTINLTDKPNDVFGKIMSLPDEYIWDYFLHATRVSIEKIEKLKKSVDGGVNPKESKEILAEAVVTTLYTKEDAERARNTFTKVFSNKEIPEDVTTISATKGDLVREVLVHAGAVSSNRQFRTLIKAGAIRDMETGTKLDTPEYIIENDIHLKIGKRTFVRITVS